MNILLFTLGLYFITAVLAQNPYSLTTADLDGNGLADIIVGAPYFTGRKSNQRTWNATDVLQNTAGSPTGDSDTPTSGPRRPETSWGQLNPDIGRVYIFYGIPSNTSDRIDSSAGRDRPDYTSRPPVVLTGPKAVGGRFGHALVNLGDLDGDGTEDLAVSCPYCTPPKGSEEKGAVLIYLGQHHVLLKDEPFEVSGR